MFCSFSFINFQLYTSQSLTYTNINSKSQRTRYIDKSTQTSAHYGEFPYLKGNKIVEFSTRLMLFSDENGQQQSEEITNSGLVIYCWL